MAFDSTTRGKLQRLVTACRNLLTDEFDNQLQSTYGVYAEEGRVLELDKLTSLDDDQRATGSLLRERIAHLQSGLAGSKTPLKDSVQRVLREQAFTVLNRFAALRMAEERELVLQCVGEGLNSKGFQVFENVASPDLGSQYERYCVFLGCLFDELSIDLGVLFDRYSPFGLLFPREPKLKEFLQLLNDPELKSLWRQDETIGWIYQYFNDPAERKQMREVAAPRNSRELAVRNQFFTPRYVVEFLIDNTLGRLWYEMTKGRTELARRCRYLVRRPNEIFLGNPNVISCLDAAAPWVREVILSADFSRLPEGPTIGELSDFGLAIDGYAEMERRSRSWDDFLATFYDPQAEAAQKNGQPWKGDAFDLWCALFAYQRSVLRNGYFSDSDRASGDATLRHLWPALRHALQNPPADLSQEEMLRQPQFIPHRPIKDPREIRLLDPACGSMHFGLYAFDLFETIYAEAHKAHVEVGTDALRDSSGRSALDAISADAAAFSRDVPRFIVECNIHGIDIDPRAAQIAGLSLWLRAQRAWHEAGVKPADRPRITRSKLVCAEPMPGEKDLLREFIEQQFPTGERPAFAFLLERIFDRMTLAGEAGSLLRIEEEIRAAIAEARALAQKHSAPRQTRLFPGDERPDPAEFDLRGLNDEQFWQAAEQRIYDALEAYAEQAENGGGFQRRLFADDTAQGFAFIDLCRKRYDVAVMNPPFGDASLPSKRYIDETYGDTKGDVYKTFVECFNARLVPAGYLGVISSRTGFFLGQSEDWRTRVVLRLFRPIALADLGMGVLDAMVEVAAYVLRNLSEQEARDLTFSLVPVLEEVVRDKQDRFSLPKWQAARDGLKRHQAIAELERLEAHGFIQRTPGDILRYAPLWHVVKRVTAPPAPVYPPFVCIRALTSDDKESAVLFGANVAESYDRFVCNPSDFPVIPKSPFAYWAGENVRGLFDRFSPFASGLRGTYVGLQTSDDFRFLRLWWEENSSAHGVTWFPVLRGGKFRRFYADIPMDVNWSEDGREIKAWAGSLYNNSHWSRIIKNTAEYFRPGLTWPLRGIVFSAQAVPAGAIFSVAGKLASSRETSELPALLGLLNSRPIDALIGLPAGKVGGVQYEAGLVGRIPVPAIQDSERIRFAHLAQNGWSEKRNLDTGTLTSRAFVRPSLLNAECRMLADRAAAWAARVRTSEATVAAIQAEIDDLAFRFYDLDAADRAALNSTLAPETSRDAEAEDEQEEEEAATADAPALTADLLDYALGCVFGRWDIRYATGERPAPELPDPFAPLPVCPPGMLQGDDGLPLSPEAGRRLRGEGSYPLDVAWDGILVDDAEHPLNLEARIHAALAVLWGDRADALDYDACALLGVPTLRDWFRRPAGFFADHLKRYSKSRRQAPIYWPLSTASGSYTLWLYYHRLNAQTLYTCVTDFVKPKLDAVTADADRLQAKTQTGGTAKEPAELQELRDFQAELQELHDELLRVAQLQWKPNLNDGVLITASPLWKLFRLPKWQKDLKTCWEALAAGDYDWAHLALSIWPDRVRAKCKTDRSLAIAHGLEELCQVEEPKPKTKRGKKGRKLERLI
jgi:hypothetical protein